MYTNNFPFEFQNLFVIFIKNEFFREKLEIISFIKNDSKDFF